MICFYFTRFNRRQGKQIYRAVAETWVRHRPFILCNFAFIWCNLYPVKLFNKPVTNPHTCDTYLVSTLIEESISSSQLEGASTTRKVAKEMLRQGRRPKDQSEQMIFNNFQAMQFIREYKEEKLMPAMILQLHRIQEHQSAHKISYQTARTDLLKLADLFKILSNRKYGNQFVFVAPPDLVQNLVDFEPLTK